MDANSSSATPTVTGCGSASGNLIHLPTADPAGSARHVWRQGERPCGHLPGLKHTQTRRVTGHLCRGAAREL
jgi:hypothetical protein